MLTPREKSLLPKMSPEEDRTHDAVDSEPKHYQLSYSGPLMWDNPLTVVFVPGKKGKGGGGGVGGKGERESIDVCACACERESVRERKRERERDRKRAII